MSAPAPDDFPGLPGIALPESILPERELPERELPEIDAGRASLDADSLFLQAVERDDPADRAALLEDRCGGDAGLRAEVEALLAAHDDAGSFLKPPAEPTHPALDRTVMSSDLPPVTNPAGTDATGPNAGPTGPNAATAGAHAGPGHPRKLGAYDISEVIGRGGMGVVLKARDPHLDRTVAIKTLAPELAADPTARRRFAREARAAAAVTHPHVVTIHAVEPGESGPDGPVPFLVMEYVAGRSLRQKLDADGSMGVTEVLRIGAQIADGLAAAHKQGLIHRDVKPGNVLLENGVERVKLTDFGLARAADDVAITRTGDIAGTPQFMSPEQAEGKPVDHRSDLFSLGAVLYAMCTGRPPFRGESAVTVLRKVCDSTPRPIREVNPDVPPWLSEIVDRLLAKNPADRFDTAAEVAAVLGERLARWQNPDFAERPTRALAPAKPRRAKGWAIAAAALAAALLIGGASEAAGVTEVIPTVVRLVRGDGTLVVRTDDPNVGVTIEGEDVILTGTGLSEIRLRPGTYQVKATKDGRAFTELVTVERNGREVVNVRWEAGGARLESAPTEFATPDAAWVTLFDGQSLEGWRAEPPAVWSVEPGGADGTDVPGVLVATLPPRVRHAQLSRIEGKDGEKRLPADFELTFRFAASPGTRLKLRTRERESSLYAEFNDPPASEEWGLLTSRVPSRAHVYYRRLNGARPPGLAQSAAAAAESVDGRVWHHVRLHVEGQTASMAVNGVELGGGTDPDLFAGPEGLRFEVYRTSSRAGDATVRLRDVRYRPLSADARPAADGSKTDPVASPDERAEPRSLPLVRTFEGHTGPVKSVAFSPDGTRAASGSGWPSGDGTVRVWDVATGETRHVLKAHTDQVLAVAYAPDGATVVSGDADGGVAWWDPQSGEKLSTARVGSHVSEIAFFPDGRRLAVVAGGTITLFDAAGATVGTIALPGPSRAVAFTPDGSRLLAAAADGRTFLIEPASGRVERSFEPPPSIDDPNLTAESVAVSADGSRVAVGLKGYRVRVWDYATGRVLRDLRTPTAANERLAFLSPDRLLVAGHMNRTSAPAACVLDVPTGRVLAGTPPKLGGGLAAAVSPDGRALLTAGGTYFDERFKTTGDYALRLWRLPVLNPAGTTADADDPFALVHRLEGHASSVNAIAVFDGGRKAVSGSEDSRIRVWDLETGALLKTIEAGAAVKSVVVTPDGRSAVVGVWAEVRWYDLESGNVVRRAELPGDDPSEFFTGLALTPDGERVIASRLRGGPVVVDAAAAKVVRTFDPPDRRSKTGPDVGSHRVALSPDGTRLATGWHSGGRDGEIVVWNLETGEVLFRQDVGHRGIADVEFSPDGTRLLAGDSGGDLTVCDLSGENGGAVLRRFRAHDDGVNSVAFLPDGRRALSAGLDGTVRLWDVETAEELARLERPDQVLQNLTLLPGGERFLTGGGGFWNGKAIEKTGDYALRLWRLSELAGPTGDSPGLELERQLPNEVRVSSVAFPSDTEVMAVSGHDLRSWNLETGAVESVELSFRGKSAISPDGGTVAVAEGQDGDETSRVQLWRRDGRKLLWERELGVKTVFEVSLTPGGDVLVTTNAERGGVFLLDAETGRDVVRLPEAGHAHGGAAVSPDGRRLFLRVTEPEEPDGREGRVYDIATGAKAFEVECPRDARTLAAVWSRDGRAILTGDDRGTVSVLSGETGELVRRWSADELRVERLALGDGDRLFCGGAGRISVRDWTTGSLLADAATPNFEGLHLAPSPDGARLVSGGGWWWHEEEHDSGDYALRLWELPDTSREPPTETTADSAPAAIRQSLARLVKAAEDGLDAADLDVWKPESPVLTLGFIDPAVGQNLLTLLGTLPEVSRRQLLRDGYLKWRYRELDEDRRERIAEFHQALLSQAKGMIDRADPPLDEEVRERFERLTVARAFLAGADVGFVVIDLGGDAGSILNWFAFAPGSPLPVSIRVLGLARTEVKEDLATARERILALRDRPYSERPAANEPADEPADDPPTLIEDVRLEGLRDFVLDLAYTPDGTRLVTAGGDGVIVWDARNGRRKQEIAGHDRTVHAVVVLPDGKRVVAGGKGDAILLSDLATGGVIRRFEGHTGFVECLAVSPDGKRIASGSSNWFRKERGDLTVRVWDAETGKELWRADPPPTDNGFGSVRQILFTADGSRVLSMHVAGEDGISVWDAATGELLRRFSGQHSSIKSAALSPDGRTLATGHDAVWVKELRWDDPQNAVVLLWDLESGEELRRLVGHAGGVQSVEFSADGERLLTCSGGQFLSDAFVPDPARDNTVRLWDVATGRELARQTLPKQGQVATLSPDGGRIASAAGVWQEEPSVQLWRVPEGVDVARDDAPPEPAERLARCVERLLDAVAEKDFQDRMPELAAEFFRAAEAVPDADADLRARVLVRAARKLRDSPELDRRLTELLADFGVASPRGEAPEVRAGAFLDLLNKLRDAPPAEAQPAGLTEVRRFRGGHVGAVHAIAVSADGARLASGSLDGTARLWDVATGKELRALLGHRGVVKAVAFSPDGGRVLTGAEDGVRLWDAGRGELLFRPYVSKPGFDLKPGDSRWISAVAFAPDGSSYAAAWVNYSRPDSLRVALFDPASENHDRLLDLGPTRSAKPNDNVWSLAYAPDGKSLYAAGEWKLIAEWSVEGRRDDFVRKFRSPPTHPYAMALSADGARMVTGHADGDALLWDVKTGQIARRLGVGGNGHAGPANAVAISPDGALIATGSGGRYDSGGYTPSEDNTVRLWDAGSGDERARVDLPVRVTGVAFTPDGERLVTGGGEPGDAEADLRLWRIGAPSR